MARASRTELGTSIGERDYTRGKASPPDEFGIGLFDDGQFGKDGLSGTNVGSGPKIGSARKENLAPGGERRPCLWQSWNRQLQTIP
jgi:hypothetical protein